MLVAVSGGADSMALLLLGHTALGERCVAATVDHGLRPDSAAEARLVAAVCAQRGISHAILTDALPERVGKTANLSARARALRYRLLEAHAREVGARFVATAHHADDQLETVVMRLNRGSGVSGLAAIRERGGPIIRPLLQWRHSELAALVAACGITAVNDPSNRDDRFDRARLRKALAGADWLDPLAVGVSAAALGDAEEALEWSVRKLSERFCRFHDRFATFCPLDLPFELRRRLVRRCITHMDPTLDIGGPALVRTVRALECGARAQLGGVDCVVDALSGGEVVWIFTRAPPRRSG